MMLLLMALALGAVGLVLRLPGRVVAAMFALLWAGALLAQLGLPEGHPLARAIGGTWQGWLMLGFAGAAVLAYRAVLRRLKVRAVPVVVSMAASASGPFSTSELERYARHIVLREVGGTGQKKLKAARVLVVGAGGLGSPALLYLAAAGVGTIGVVDDDAVSNSNLQRQIIHTDARIGQPKVRSAAAAMKALNPFVSIECHAERLIAARATELFARYDLILDGSDNSDTRLMVNAAAVVANKPLISGAISQWEGQIGLNDPGAGGPCYACVFPEVPAEGLALSCAEAGVIAPLPGVIGSMMALEAVKHLTGAGQTLLGSLVIYDGLWGESRKVAVARRADCAHGGAGRGVVQER